MTHKLNKDSRGVAHVALIAVALVVIGAVGFAGYQVMNKDKSPSSTADKAVQEAAKEECKKIDDDDLCKFFSSWKTSTKYSMTSTDKNGEKSIFKFDGERSYASLPVDGNMYEVISIGKVTYTKAGDVWYKHTAKTTEESAAKDYKVDFAEPTEDDGTATDKTSYKKLGKEVCGNLSCFKYQVIDADVEESDKEFIWFDDKDFRLRRTRSETKDGATDMIFSYENVSVNEPSPVKELEEGQFIMPGQTEPTTLR